MIQIAAGLPTLTAGPTSPVLLAAQSGTSNFALALSTLLVPGAVPKALPGEVKIAELPAAGRQGAAEPGKELPEIALDLSGDEEAPEQNAEADDDAPASEDLPFAWFAQPVVPAPDAVVTAPVAAPKAIKAEMPAAEIVLPETAVPAAPVPQAKPVIAVTAKAAPAAQAVTATEPVPAVQPAIEAGAVRAPGEAIEPKAALASHAADPAVTPLRYRLAERPVAVAQRATLRAVGGETPDAAAPVVALTAMAAPMGVPAASPALPATAQIPATAPVSTAAAPVLAAAAPVPAAAAPLPAATISVAPAAVPVPAAAPIPAAAPVAQLPLAAIAAPIASQPVEAPAPAPIPEAAPATVDVLAPRVQAAVPAAQPVGHFAPDPAQPLTVASLIAQASVQSVTQPAPLAALRRSLADSDQPAVTGVTTPSAAILQQVAATPDAQQGTLDMRRHEWTGKMVEMIEAMRDAAPVKETRITLMPEALGKVDIAVRQDGDRVHVHFTAETQAARQILTDAQPRLNEIAEQRGIRLGQTSVEQQGAGAQSGHRQGDAPRNQTPSAPASARTANTTTDTDDERIA